LPIKIPADRESLIDALKKDKKRQSEDIYFVLLRGIGKSEVTKMSFPEIEEYIDDLYKYR